MIIFHPNGNLAVTPIIHRAIMYVTLHNNGTYATADVDKLSQLTGWEATTDSGPITCPPSCSGLYLKSLTIHRMGFRQDLNITFDFVGFFFLAPRAGYITMGDYNAEFGATFDRQWLAAQRDIIGRARGEIPWFGLLKLTLQPTDSCCMGWGDEGGQKGFYTMNDSWFDEYTFEIAARKTYLPNELRAALETQPIVLPAWDPMGALARCARSLLRSRIRCLPKPTPLNSSTTTKESDFACESPL